MTPEKKIYDEDDAICVECIEDDGLRELVRSEGEKQECSVCGDEDLAVSIKGLAEILDPYLREHYRHGHLERRYGRGDDDSYIEEQQGEDLDFIIQEMTGQYFDFQDLLVDTLIDSDPADVRDGGEPFYEQHVNYVETRVYVGHLYDEWRAISDELKTERRFFSDRARKFFDWLFSGIEDLWFYEGKESPIPIPLSELKKLGVIQEWPGGTVVFRARRADTREDYTRLMLNPAVELAPPPSRFARTGRMNAEGVTIFYGGLDTKTCLAEMRSSIGGYNVLGSFVTSKPLRLLDFSRLDKAFWDGKPLSYFQIDFNEQVTRRNFRRRLHKLISEPVIPGHEDEYLITQVLAEYLAYVRTPNFDGLLFASTQYEDGTNVVLFPKHAGAVPEEREHDPLATFPLKYVDESVEIYKTRGIKYDIPNIDFTVVKDGIYLHDRDYDDDDD